jgi:hypothetical protein
MPKHRGGVLTRYGAATPLCPSGFACALLGGLAEVPQEPATWQAARLSGTGPSASLGLLDVALAMPSEPRLPSGPVALVTRLAPLLQHPFNGPDTRSLQEMMQRSQPIPE